MSRFTDLRQRLWVSLILVTCLAGLIVFAYNPIIAFLIIALVITIAVMGVWEYGHLAEAKGLHPSMKLMVVIAIFEIAGFFLAHKIIDWPELPILVLSIGMGLLFVNHFRSPVNALTHTAVEFFGVVYVSVPMSFTLGILYPVVKAGAFQDGRWWLFYLLFVTKITDVAAYFFGKLLGKRPLALHLSPKKTIEGAIAGFFLAIVSSLIFAKYGPMFADPAFQLSFFDALWLGCVLGVLGQVGDLAESLLKRDAALKDSNIIPGVGGVLDMIDSLIFTSPIIYFFLKWNISR